MHPIIPSYSLQPNFTTIKHKSFYFNRIQIYLIHEPSLDIYTITLVDYWNPSKPIEFSPYGIFTLQDGISKFESINL
jgi:hypothetical protein